MSTTKLYLLALTALAVSPVYGQFVGAFNCQNVSGQAPILRAGGHAELVGEIVYDCSGGSGVQTSDINVFLNGNYTGRIVEAASSTTESLLIVGDPATPVLGTNVFRGVLTAVNAVRFSGVTLQRPGSGTLRLRVVNLRVDTGENFVRNAEIPNQVFAMIESSSIPFNQSQTLVGFAAVGQRFRITDAAGNSRLSLRFNGAGTTTYRVHFEEGSPAAFRKRNTATTVIAPTALAPQAEYGRDYGTESGFYLPGLGVSDSGLAGQGTRLMARFTNLPTGASLAVSALPVGGSAVAQLISTGADGSGAYAPVTPGADGMVPLTVSGGVATAVWEVLSADPAVLESLQFSLVVTSPAGADVHAGAYGQFAPVNLKNTADASAPVPRFGAPVLQGEVCGANCLSVPAAISVSYTVGAAAPGPIAIPVSSTGGALAFQAIGTSGSFLPDGVAPPDVAWLSVSPASGTTPAVLSATVNPAGLIPGRYSGLITVTSGRYSERIFVALQVRPDAAGTFRPSCVSNSGVPPIVRSTGVAELQGEYVAICLIGTTGVTTDVRVSLNTTVTSRPNDLLLLLDEPSPPQQAIGSSVYRAERVSDTQVVFRNVFLPPSSDPQGPMYRILRVVNVFADVSRLGLSGTAIPTQVRAIARLSAIPNESAQQTLGFVQPSLVFRLLNSSNTDAPNLAGAANGKLRFQEWFAAAFRRRNVGTTFEVPGSLSAQFIPGAIYNTETGFYNPALPNAGGIDMGLASQGTRLIARFNNIPAGMGISVSVNEVGATSSPKAQLTQTDANGAGAYAAIPGPMAPVTITNGTGIAVWEVMRSDPLSNESFEFGLQLTGTVPAGATVEGLLGPLSTVNTSSTSAPMPRFAAANVSNPVCPSFPCLRVAPISLTSNGTAIASAAVSVTSDSDPVPFTVLDPAVPWLRVQVGAGVTPGQFTVYGDPAGLAAGTYTTTLGVGSLSVPVTFIVQAAGPAALLLPVDRLLFAFNAGVAPAVQTFTLGGTAGLPWTATINAPWLRLAGSSGTAPSAVIVRVDVALLPPGEYDGTITFTAAGAAAVTLLVHASVAANSSYSIRGTIYDLGGPRANVTVTLSGAEPRMTTSAADGSYLFAGLTSGGPHTVTPSAAGVTFTPASATFASVFGPQFVNFSVVPPGSPPVIAGVWPTTVIGPSATFQVRSTDADGAANISRIYFLVNEFPNVSANTCHGFFDRSSRKLYLYDDTLATLLGPSTPGTAANLENSQCRVVGQASAPGADAGMEVSFQLAIALKGAYGSKTQNLHLWAQDVDGNGTGWVNTAVWRPLGLSPPLITSLLVSGALDTFRFTAEDADNNLSRAYFLVNTSPNVQVNGCHGYYDFPSNTFALFDDALATLGTENSSCAIDPLASSRAANGEVTIGLRRKGGAAAAKLYLWITDTTGLGTGWVDFDVALPARPNVAPVVTTSSPATGTGTTRLFTAQITDANTRFDVTRVYFLINPNSTIPANTCHGYWDRATKTTYLYNDALTALSSTTLENSQCRVNFVPPSGETDTAFTLGLNATAKGAYLTTALNVYFWAVDGSGSGTGWVPISAWGAATNSAPTVVVGTPAALTGSPVTFPLVGRDTDGAGDISRLYFLLHPNPNIPQNTCHGFFDTVTNSVYLYNDALTALLGPVTPGAAQTIQNSQCAINGAASSVAAGPTDVTLNLNVTVKTTGDSNMYLWAVDKQGSGTGWVRTASWAATNANRTPVIPASNAPVNGPTVRMALTARDLDGAADIQRLYFLVNTDTGIPPNTCHGFYDRAANAVFLYNDGLNGFATNLQNSQCTVSLGAGGISTSPDGLGLTVNLTFTLNGPVAPTARNIYLWARDRQNADTGWVQVATWLPAANSGPGFEGIFPVNLGSADTAVVPLDLADPDGAVDIERVYFLIADSPQITANGCHGFVLPKSRGLYLYSDSLGTLLGPGSPQNTQCGVSLTGLDVVAGPAAYQLRVSIPFRVTTAYRGSGKKLYIWVVDQQGNGTGWFHYANWN